MQFTITLSEELVMTALVVRRAEIEERVWFDGLVSDLLREYVDSHQDLLPTGGVWEK